MAAVAPNDPIPYYSLGFIAWSKWYPEYGTARAKLGMKPEEMLNDNNVCAVLKEKNTTFIDDGIAALDKALEKIGEQRTGSRLSGVSVDDVTLSAWRLEVA